MKLCTGDGDGTFERLPLESSIVPNGDGSVSPRMLGSAISCGSGVGQLQVCEHLLEIAERLGRHGALENRDERLQALDREPRLLEILLLAAQAVVAEGRDCVERLQQEVGDLELGQLGLKLLDKLLLLLRRLAHAA